MCRHSHTYKNVLAFTEHDIVNICTVFDLLTHCASRSTDGSLAYKEKEVPVSVVALTLCWAPYLYYIAGEDDEEKLGLYQKVACEEH